MNAVIRETAKPTETTANVASGKASAQQGSQVSGHLARPPAANVGNSARPQPTVVRSGDSTAALLALLKIEADIRQVTTERDLIFLIANETRKLTRARQIFVLKRGLSGGLEVAGVSSLAKVDRNAPLVALIEKTIAAYARDKRQVKDLKSMTPVTLPAEDATASAYPFRALFWVPLVGRDETLLGGLLLAREDDWQDADMVVAKRLASAYAHAWTALRAPTREHVRKLLKPQKWHVAVAVSAVCALFLVRVPLTALAPVEVIARDPFVVTAPMDGVIERVVVDINEPVQPGTTLIEMADTTLRNRLEVASREVEVATARLKQVNQLAFTDPQGMHDLGIARAELQLKLAEETFARELLNKSKIKAEEKGVAIFADKRELTGKPVAVGERILEIADPSRVEARISLPVADAIALKNGASVKLFLDSDPLRPWHGTVRRADYKARVTEADVVSFRIVANIQTEDGDRPLPRLGTRGSAQVFGENVSLAFYLFRRPLTAARQWLGI